MLTAEMFVASASVRRYDTLLNLVHVVIKNAHTPTSATITGQPTVAAGPRYALMYRPDDKQLPYVEIDGNGSIDEIRLNQVNLLAVSVMSDPLVVAQTVEDTCVYLTPTGDVFVEFLAPSPTNNWQFDGAATFQLFVSGEEIRRNTKGGAPTGAYLVSLTNAILRKVKSRLGDDTAMRIIDLVKLCEYAASNPDTHKIAAE